jgi:putative glutamine amidotransferase
MKKKPIIGVTPLYDYNLKSWWIIPGYMKGVLEFGGIPVLLPFDNKEEDAKELADLCDGFIFTGGPDVNPGLYGEDCLLEMGLIAPIRDVNEKTLLKAVEETGKPVLGICRGYQLINVMRGGTLYQDIDTQFETETRHDQLEKNYITTHYNDVAEGSPLYKWLGNKTELKVNSFHHQGVKSLGKGLEPMATSRGDGLVEAFYDPSMKYFVGIQWHPELLREYHDEEKLIFKSLVDAASEE